MDGGRILSEIMREASDVRLQRSKLAVAVEVWTRLRRGQ
jgi:hypothetical protein